MGGSLVRGSSPSSSPLHCWCGSPRSIRPAVDHGLSPQPITPIPNHGEPPHPRIPGTRGYILVRGHVTRCLCPIQGFPTQLFPRSEIKNLTPPLEGEACHSSLSLRCDPRGNSVVFLINHLPRLALVFMEAFIRM